MLIVVPAVGAVLVLLLSKRRPEYMRLVAAIAVDRHRRPQRLADRTSSTVTTTASSSCRSTRGSRSGGSAGTSASTASRCSSCCSPALLFPLAILGIDPHNEDPAKDKPYFAWLLLLEAGVMGSFLSLDLFLFFVFFEIVLVPMYFLIGGLGLRGPRRAPPPSSSSTR